MSHGRLGGLRGVAGIGDGDAELFEPAARGGDRGVEAHLANRPGPGGGELDLAGVEERVLDLGCPAVRDEDHVVTEPESASGQRIAPSYSIARRRPSGKSIHLLLENLPMKAAADAILRSEQAQYLDALHQKSVRALAVMAGVEPVDGREPLLARMEARAAERGYPISDPEVACLLAVLARLAAAEAHRRAGHEHRLRSHRPGSRGRRARRGS